MVAIMKDGAADTDTSTFPLERWQTGGQIQPWKWCRWYFHLSMGLLLAI
ncbi:MAG: hypothetical protein AAGJ35_12435 [Myxococcota bacterium]